MSDIYAMGGHPVTALNIVCFPVKELPREMLANILRGGIDKVHEAGAVLVGGHSVDDPEPKFGLAVTGIVDPSNFVTNAGARPGDRLILTKPIGTGILSTAHKAGLLPEETLQKMIKVMKALNRAASEAMMEVGVHAATDITGFGLIGHGLEMAEASQCKMVIEAGKIVVLDEAIKFLGQGLIPEGDYAIKRFCSRQIVIHEGIDRDRLEILFDAQTSGGLLIAVPEEKADLLFTRLLEKGLVEIGLVGHMEEGHPSVEIIP